jgi:hypothetical protein
MTNAGKGVSRALPARHLNKTNSICTTSTGFSQTHFFIMAAVKL